MQLSFLYGTPLRRETLRLTFYSSTPDHQVWTTTPKLWQRAVVDSRFSRCQWSDVFLWSTKLTYLYDFWAFACVQVMDLIQQVSPSTEVSQQGSAPYFQTIHSILHTSRGHEYWITWGRRPEKICCSFVSPAFNALFSLDHGNLSSCCFTWGLKQLRQGQTSASYVDITQAVTHPVKRLNLG